MELTLGWDFNVSIWLAAGIVLVYIFLGGLTSAVYNEVLQFFLIVLGIAPLVYLGLIMQYEFTPDGWVKFIPEENTTAPTVHDAKEDFNGRRITIAGINILGTAAMIGVRCASF